MKMPYIGYYEMPDEGSKTSPAICFDAFGWVLTFLVVWRFEWPGDWTAAATVVVWSADHKTRRFALFGWGWSKCDVPRVPLIPVVGWMPDRLDGFRIGWLGFYLQLGPK